MNARPIHRFLAVCVLGLVPVCSPVRADVDGQASSGRGRAAKAAPPPAPAGPKVNHGEDPDFAARMGWPVKGPDPLPGAILPSHRIVAYYGNPLSKQMGILGEVPPDEMFRRFEKQLDEWRKADPATPVLPAFHLISVVAQGEPGPSGKYRTIMRDALVEQVYGWAKSKNAIMFIDIQVGQSDIRELLPKFDGFLSRPDVHLAIDPEFAMKASGRVPGTKIGTLDASDVNYASDHLAEIVRKNHLPPKVFIVQIGRAHV